MNVRKKYLLCVKLHDSMYHTINQSIFQSIFIMPEGNTESHNKMLKQERAVQKQTQTKN